MVRNRKLVELYRILDHYIDGIPNILLSKGICYQIHMLKIVGLINNTECYKLNTHFKSNRPSPIKYKKFYDNIHFKKVYPYWWASFYDEEITFTGHEDGGQRRLFVKHLLKLQESRNK